MKRIKKHKREKTESSRSRQETQDLTALVNDRVELLHQAFLVLNPRDIRAMLPRRLRDAPMEEIKVQCLDEMLGISSKRLLAILEGESPPSNTDTSSDSSPRPSHHMLGNVSLEEISSDEAALYSVKPEKNKKHKKCKRKEARRKKKKAHSKQKVNSDDSDENSKTTDPSGMTVLELLEMQARARAIRAQINKETKKNIVTATVTRDETCDDDDVLIKEEPTEVVELVSSDDDFAGAASASYTGCSTSKEGRSSKEKKVDVNRPSSDYEQQSTDTQTEPTVKVEAVKTESDYTETQSRDLTVILPKQSTMKIKLNRSKPKTYVTGASASDVAKKTNADPKETIQAAASSISDNRDEPSSSIQNKTVDKSHTDVAKVVEKEQNKPIKLKRRKKKKKRVQRKSDTDGSDHDELTLQVSDGEMDLLEGLDRKRFDNFSSSITDESTNDSVYSHKETSQICKQITEEKTDETSEECSRTKSCVQINTNREVIALPSQESHDEPLSKNDNENLNDQSLLNPNSSCADSLNSQLADTSVKPNADMQPYKINETPSDQIVSPKDSEKQVSETQENNMT